MKGKNYKIVSLYSFFPFQENLILDLKNKLLEIEIENDLSGLLIFASEGINGTICAEKNVIDIVINLLNKYSDNTNLNIKVNFSKKKVFKKLKGWQCSTADCRKLSDLPENAMNYLRFLAELMEVPIAIVSLGANRDQTIVIEDPIHGPKRALLR